MRQAHALNQILRHHSVAVQRAVMIDYFTHTRAGVDTTVLQHHAHVLVQRATFVQGVETKHPHRARSWTTEALAHLERGRFARAIGAENDRDLPRSSGKRDAVYCSDLVVLHDEPFHFNCVWVARGVGAHRATVGKPHPSWRTPPLASMFSDRRTTSAQRPRDGPQSDGSSAQTRTVNPVGRGTSFGCSPARHHERTRRHQGSGQRHF